MTYAYDVYLLGPMGGYADMNRPAFNAWAAKLKAKGFKVCNPAELDNQFGEPERYEDYYARDMMFVPKCRMGVALPGWETYFGRSRGATWEAYTLGVLLKRPILALPDLTPIPADRLPQIRVPEDVCYDGCSI
jgi:hypothetical protein